MDLARIPFQTFQAYDQREPGFAIPMLQAYITAFQMKTEGKISHELLKSIHQTAMSHMRDPGGSEYREDWGCFRINLYTFGKSKVPTYAATPEGIKQFVMDWIDNPMTGTHSLSFTNDPKPGEAPFAYAIKRSAGKTLFCNLEAGQPKAVIFNAEKHLPLFIDILKNRQDIICDITTLNSLEQSQLQAKTQLLMQNIIHDYEHEIAEAKEDNDKIKVICKYVQRIDQLHPFMDGNIRTCYILLNKLLHDFNLPLALVINPNRLDCCTVDEVVSMVKEGQDIYKSLLAHQDPNKFIINTRQEIVPEFKSFSCEGVDLKNSKVCDDFLRTVVNAEAQELKKETPTQALIPKGFFDEIQKAGATAPLMKVIKEGNYSLAFRQACAANAPLLVKSLLKFKDSLKLDVNQPSTNGHTALDWFDLKTTATTQRDEVRALLIKSGAKNNKVSSLEPVRSQTPQAS